MCWKMILQNCKGWTGEDRSRSNCHSTSLEWWGPELGEKQQEFKERKQSTVAGPRNNWIGRERDSGGVKDNTEAPTLSPDV